MMTEHVDLSVQILNENQYVSVMNRLAFKDASSS